MTLLLLNSIVRHWSLLRRNGHHGIVCPSHAQKLPLSFIWTLSVSPSS